MSISLGTCAVPLPAIDFLLACALIWAVMPTPGLAQDFQRLLQQGGVPGLAIAVVRDGEVVARIAEGMRNAHSREPVDDDTIFEAASLSKPVFAYAVLQLVDAGKLSLDTQLSSYVADYVAGDPAAAGITVRQVLSHTSGLPNWRSKELPLKTYFPPGERFSYSGEGFVWLQRVVEVVTGEALDQVVQRLVFDPLGMRRSSYTWRSEFDANRADPHDSAMAPGTKLKPAANAAYSLCTTASDYARFLQAVLSGERLSPATARLWLDAHVHIRRACFQCLADMLETDQRVAWGLGWGLEPDRGTFFHWGDNGRFKAFVVGSLADRTAAVVFTNGANGMAIMPHIIERVIPGEHPAFKWLNYPAYNPSPQ
jgi:CubicO group peptidase (beta-lactamase class C family)